MRETLDSVGITGAEVQQRQRPGLGANVFQIQSHQLDPAEVKRPAERAGQGIRDQAADGFDSTSVGPTFGQTGRQQRRQGADLLAAGDLRLRRLPFDPKFAVPVLIALFHDILITAGVYSLTGKEVSSGTVAAFLTILGYSLYDTIIVFDRIRENMPRMPRAAFSQIVNRSMSEVLTRSLATSFSTLLAIGSLLVFGGATLQGLRLRDAGRDRLRNLLVDLHRFAGPDRLEGARAGLRAAPSSGSREADGSRAGLRRRGRAGAARRRRRDATRRSRARLPSARRSDAAGAVATAEPRPATGDGAGAGTDGAAAAAGRAAAERRERNAERRERRQQRRRKHGRNR